MLEADKTIYLRAHFSPPHGALLVYAYGVDQHGKRLMYDAQLCDPRTIEHGAAASPLMVLQPDGARMLMDSLWESGVRPSEHTNSLGQVAAMEKHIGDLRNIVDQNYALLGRLVKGGRA